MINKTINNFLFFFLICIASANAQNPIIKGFADPAMHIYNGKMYMLVGKDEGPEIKKFTMPYWAIYSSSDLINWKEECVIDPKDSYLGKGYNGCWAGDITSKNGKYYCYFSEGGEATGVLVADKPEGPYVDVLKKSMIPKEFSDNKEYDATAFTDDDGTKYIIYGRDGFLAGKIIHYQIAKLSNDMLSLGEAPKDFITQNKYGFGAENRARDHSYFHKHNGTYYISCGNVYATSTNIYGPYSNLKNAGGDAGCHSSFSDYNGQSYLSWENTCDPFGNRMYRQVMMAYLHYNNNGDMVIDENFTKQGKHYATGVGNYSANWDTLQAEWFFKKSAITTKKECPTGGFEIQNLNNNSYLNFPNVKDLQVNATINFRVSAETKNVKIEVRADSPTGTLLGTCVVPKTGSFTNYQIASCNLKNSTKTTNLYFVIKGGKGDLVHMDSFNFFK
jgi:hypothetical protein